MKAFGRLVLSVLFGTLTVSRFGHAVNETKVEDAKLSEEALLAFIEEAKNALPPTDNDKLFKEKVEYILTQSKELEELQTKLAEKQKSLDKLASQANAKQLESLVSRMKETLEKELKLRVANKAGENDIGTELLQDGDIEELDSVLISDLSNRLEATNMLDQSEQVIQSWVLDIIEDEVEQYQEKLLSQKGDVSCPLIKDIVSDVHLALTKFSQDGIGLIDHAQGGEIVHYFTSPTYTPPPDTSEVLGSVWWRKYIPEDWEKLLPSGWETWNTGLPSYVYHTLGIKGAKTAPPETILEKKTVPGACWPMKGSTGQITVRLPYPVYIDSVTLDHVLHEIIPNDMYKSAPKKIEVIGYPACNKGDDCFAIGFDMKDPITIAKIDYDIEGASFQTFDSLYAEAMNHKEDEEEDSEDDATCSTQTTCSSPPRVSVGGIKLKILENWGNSEYTCLYRFRVHGEVVMT